MRTPGSGVLLIAIGVVHQVFGVLAGLGVMVPPNAPRRRPLVEIAEAGFVNAVGDDPLRNTVFWFLFFGFVLLILGDLVRRIERAGRPLPRALGWQIGALALGGVLLIPASGFWLVLPVVYQILRHGGRPATEDTVGRGAP